jgi:hypothetical protein
MQAHPEAVNWEFLSRNPSDWARDMLRTNQDNIDWRELAANPAEWARDLLRTLNPDSRNVLRMGLCENVANWAGDMLREYMLWPLDWIHLNANPAPWAIALLEANPGEKIWPFLCLNSSDWAGAQLAAYPECIHWRYLSGNGGDWAVALLKANPEKINRRTLYRNDSAWAVSMWSVFDTPIYLEEAWMMTVNPAIFAMYDYEKLKRDMALLRAELLRDRMHPRHVHKLKDDWKLL